MTKERTETTIVSFLEHFRACSESFQAVAKKVVVCVFSRSVFDMREQKKRKKARFALSAIASLSDGGSPASKDYEQALRSRTRLRPYLRLHK